MDLLQAAYESGDVKWLIPALVGALIVFLGLVRMLFSETVGWALAMLIVFGGALSGATVFSQATLVASGNAPARASASADTASADAETVAAMRAAGEQLKQAISANTMAIENIQSAVTEMRDFTEMLAVASNAALGDVAITSAEIAKFNSGVKTLLSESDAALVRSRDAELAAVRTLDVLQLQVAKKLQSAQ